MAMQANEIENMIREQFPNASITITDLAGDGNHYSAEVIDVSFSKTCERCAPINSTQ